LSTDQRFCGRHDRALEQLAQAERSARNHAGLLQKVAKLYVKAGKYERAGALAAIRKPARAAYRAAAEGRHRVSGLAAD
jgi:hypothetical protein